jgi:hypothetical protein
MNDIFFEVNLHYIDLCFNDSNIYYYFDFVSKLIFGNLGSASWDLLKLK